MPDSKPAATDSTDARTLLVFFSRAGENYFDGGRRNLTVGNTKVLAGFVRDLVDIDVYEIEAADPYSNSYDTTVDRNLREQDADARPAIANPLPLVGDFDTVLIGSPIWNSRPPMIMSTFVEAVDLAGKAVHPFVTYAVSGLGSTERVYRELAPRARFGASLAVRGEDVGGARPRAETWLRQIGLLT